MCAVYVHPRALQSASYDMPCVQLAVAFTLTLALALALAALKGITAHRQRRLEFVPRANSVVKGLTSPRRASLLS